MDEIVVTDAEAQCDNYKNAFVGTGWGGIEKVWGEKITQHEGYYQITHTPGLWRQTTRPIQFILIVDDFCIKYVGKEHALHLEPSLHPKFKEVAPDWDVTLFCGISLKWDYENNTVDLSMPGYIDSMLHIFQHTPPPPKNECI